jgi:3-oxoacyl-[acyl-carrier-protein] synthase II
MPDRSGAVVGEGAAVLMLEAEEHARARDVKVYAEVAGFGASCGAQLVEEVAEEGRAAREAMAKALADAGVDAKDVTAVFADASGLPEDEAEARAIADVLGKKRATTARASVGHTMAASGALDAATAAMCTSKDVIPGVYGVDLDDPLVDVRSVQDAVYVKAVLVNSFTFGGQTASIVFKRYRQ